MIADDDPISPASEQQAFIEELCRKREIGGGDEEARERTDRLLHIVASQTSTPFRVVQELLQNADDASYPEGTTPSLTIDISSPRFLILHGNQLGMTSANVNAICEAALSSKRENSEQIGEKGLGFKAVFSIAHTVYIRSGGYFFKLDSVNKLGMIKPVWVESGRLPGRLNLSGIPPDDTVFALQLDKHKISGSITELLDVVYDMPAEMLLFLRRLKTITVVGESGSRTIKRAASERQIARFDVQRIVTETSVQGSVDSRDVYFIMFKYSLKMQNVDCKQRPLSQTTIKLAFPCLLKGPSDDRAFFVPRTDCCSLYAFLPVKETPFKFIIHADLVLLPNREDFDHKLPWNKKILDAVPDYVEQSLRQMVRIKDCGEKLKYRCLRWLPSNQSHSGTDISVTGFDTVFMHRAKRMVSKMRDAPCIVDLEGNLLKPSECLHIRSEFTFEGAPLVYPAEQRIASLAYGTEDLACLRGLGCKAFVRANLSDGLKLMKNEDYRKKLDDHGVAWFSRLFHAIDRELANLDVSYLKQLTCMPARPRTMPGPADAKPTLVRPVNFRLSLPIDRDDPEADMQADIEKIDENILFVCSELLGSGVPARLDVKPASKARIVEIILKMHGKPAYHSSLLREHQGKTLLSRHYEFIVAHEDDDDVRMLLEKGKTQRSLQLQVECTDGSFSALCEVYYDRTGHLCRIFEESKFLRPPRNAATLDFLSRHCDAIPQLDWASAAADPETAQFRRALADETKTEHVLHWLCSLQDDQLEQLACPAFVSAVGNMKVRCNDGQLSVVLKDCYLATKDFAMIATADELPVLDCDKVWLSKYKRTLPRFGVTTKANTAHWIKMLRRLASSSTSEADLQKQVEPVYAQLSNVRKEDDEQLVRKAFATGKFILAPSIGTEDARFTWRGLEDDNGERCFWDFKVELPTLQQIAPDDAQTQIDRAGLFLKRNYPACGRLFSHILGIGDLTVQHLPTLLCGVIYEDIHRTRYRWPLQFQDVAVINDALDLMAVSVSSATTEAYTEALDTLGIYLTKSEGHVAARENNGRLVIADDIAASLFTASAEDESIIIFLDIEPSREPIRRSLLKLASKPIHRFSEVVRRSRERSGHEQLDAGLTKRLRQHRLAIARYVWHHCHELLPPSVAARLCEARVYQVEEIVETLTLEVDGHIIRKASPHCYAMHDTDGHEPDKPFQLFVQASGHTAAVSIPSQLESLFDAIAELFRLKTAPAAGLRQFLLMIWSQSESEVSSYLREKCIAELPAEHAHALRAATISQTISHAADLEMRRLHAQTRNNRDSTADPDPDDTLTFRPSTAASSSTEASFDSGTSPAADSDSDDAPIAQRITRTLRSRTRARQAIDAGSDNGVGDGDAEDDNESGIIEVPRLADEPTIEATDELPTDNRLSMEIVLYGEQSEDRENQPSEPQTWNEPNSPARPTTPSATPQNLQLPTPGASNRKRKRVAEDDETLSDSSRPDSPSPAVVRTTSLSIQAGVETLQKRRRRAHKLRRRCGNVEANIGHFLGFFDTCETSDPTVAGRLAAAIEWSSDERIFEERDNALDHDEPLPAFTSDAIAAHDRENLFLTEN